MTTHVPAVERAIRILNAFKDGQLEFGVSELSHTLEINKSTVYGIVQTLSGHRLLEQDPTTRKYRLGSGLIELGALVRTRRDLRQIARPLLLKLMERTQETALLGVFEEDGITIIDVVEPAQELNIAVTNGQRLPFSAGSFGRAFLAWMDEADVDRLIAAQGLRRYTKTSITRPANYKADLRRVKRQGYAVDDSEEYLEGIWAISAPVFDTEGILAAVTVVGFDGRMPSAAKQAAIDSTVETAEQISISMGASLTQADS